MFFKIGTGTNFERASAGGYPVLEITGVHQNNGQYEYIYYPYKTCMSVHGAWRILIDLYADECGYNFGSKVCLKTIVLYKLDRLYNVYKLLILS